MSGVRDVLVVELLGGLGDVLLVLPAIHALARSHPDARVTVVTFAPGDELLRGDPAVAEVVTVTDHAQGAARAVVDAVLARGGWDLAVTTTTYDGIGAACRAGAARAVTDLWAGAPDGDRVDRRFLRLLVSAGAVREDHVDTPLRMHVTPGEVAAGAGVLRGVLGDAAGGAARAPVLLVPGSGMPVKRWRDDRWESLADRLRAAGRPVLTVGDGATAVPGALPLPALGLRPLAGVLAAAAARGGVAVGGDTGPMRLAAACGLATVGLYGPTSAGRYGLPPGPGADLQGLPGCRVRRPSSITEQECWWSARCPLSRTGRPACMTDIGVDAVAAAVRDALAAAAGAGPPGATLLAAAGATGST